MITFRTLLPSALALAFLAAPCFAADVTVSSPGAGAPLSSPFTLSAAAPSCSSQPVAAMGYSFDNSSSTTVVNAVSINASVTSSTGQHTLHVKAWGNQGSSCVTDVVLNIKKGSLLGALTLPVQAIGVKSIQALTTWAADHDGATAGDSTGSTSIVGSPSLAGGTRKFAINFTNSSGERYYASFGSDAYATNFIYDTYVYLTSTSSKISNLEFDLNQVTANGETVIYGFQCDGWTGTWDYTANTGTSANPVDVWVHSSQPCNPRAWKTNVWHHLQISYSRNSSGQVTWNTVYLDGAAMPINATVNSSFALGWSPTLLTNFQIDGFGASGSATVYMDNLTIYRW